MEAQVFTFPVDTDTSKLVAVQQRGRSIDVTVRYATDVVLDEKRTRIRNAIGLQLRTDDRGLTIEWKAPLIPCVDWLSATRRRRF